MSEFNAAIKNRFVKISIILFIISIILFIFTPPQANAVVYKLSIYPFIREILNQTLGRIPFPSTFIILPLMIFGLIYFPVKQILRKKYITAILHTVSYIFSLITIFLWIWGFHYNNPILVPQPKLEEHPIQAEKIIASFHRAEELRNLFPSDSISPLWDQKTIQLVEDSGRVWLQKAIVLLGDTPSKASNKVSFWPDGFILRWGIVGMYFPFSGESTVDGGLHSIRFASTTLHEWAHSMGYTNEGDCNLLAYLAAQFSHDEQILYSAEIERLREEMFFAAMQNPELYDVLRQQLPQTIEKDLIDIQKHHFKYRGKMNQMGNWINDQYLKTLSGDNGVDEYWLWVIKLHILEEKIQKDKSISFNNSRINRF